LKRYRQRSRIQWIPLLFNRFTLKYWIIAGILLILALGGLLIVQENQKVSPQDTPLYAKKQIVVGIAADVPKFGTENEAGRPSGFERDIAEALIRAVYGQKDVAYVTIDAQRASYLLREKQIDLAFGMFTRDVLKTQGLSVSDGYFKDGVYAFVAPDSGIQALPGIQGKKINVMTSEIKQSLVSDALKESNFDVDLYPCSSYPDGIQGVLSGNSAALVAPRCKMLPYMEQLVMVEPKITDTAYCALAWSSNRNTILLFDQEIGRLQKEGTLDILAAKWGLEQEPAGE